jgi:hypothetical protein
MAALAFGGLTADGQQPGGRVGLRHGQIDQEERVAVADGPALTGLVQADRNLDADTALGLVAARQPGPQSAREDGEQDVVQGGRVNDRLSGGPGSRARPRRMPRWCCRRPCSDAAARSAPSIRPSVPRPRRCAGAAWPVQTAGHQVSNVALQRGPAHRPAGRNSRDMPGDVELQVVGPHRADERQPAAGAAGARHPGAPRSVPAGLPAPGPGTGRPGPAR